MLQHMRDASEKRYRYIRRTADTRIEMEMEMESDVSQRHALGGGVL